MIFNDKINNILEVMFEIDDGFRNHFKEFSSSLPKDIIDKCKKGKNFDIDIDDCGKGYMLDRTYTEYQFSVVNYDREINTTIDLLIESFSPGKLQKLKVCHDEVDIEEESVNICSFIVTDDDSGKELLDYVYSLYKTEKGMYRIVLEKKLYNITGKNDDEVLERKVKDFSFKELNSKLNPSIFKR